MTMTWSSFISLVVLQLFATAVKNAPPAERPSPASVIAELDRAREGRWQGPFFFVQLADTQFGYASGTADLAYEDRVARAAVAHINRLRPRFVIITGDLVDGWPGDPRRAAQVARFRQIFNQLDRDIPLLYVSGNHDTGTPANRDRVEAFRRDFGPDHYTFWVGGTKCVVLDSELLRHPGDAEALAAEQRRFLRRELEASEREHPKHLFVFQHHPWFVEEAAEPDGYFNMPASLRRELLPELLRFDVRAVFAGHLHRNAGVHFGPIDMVTTGPISLPAPSREHGPYAGARSGFRIVRVLGDRIDHRFYALDSDEVPERVPLDESGPFATYKP